MYQKVDTSHDFAGREEPVLDFWKQNKIFERSITEKSESAPIYTFYDGPPTANGKPHIGHVLTRAVKDAIPRYRTMKGYRILRKAGWDTHGLPVELEVEKQLGISGKPEIETYGIEPFIQKCKESVWGYESLWKEMSERVAYWADMEDPYVTYNNNYIESVWWALSEIWKQGLIYKGYRVVPYCPRCGTPLSSHEVSQGYKDVTETSAIVKFQVKDEENTYILAWTTTPWTLPSNVSLCVNPNEEYVKANQNGEVFILAKALATQVLGEDYNIVETLLGKDLAGTAYKPLFSFAPSSVSDAESNYCTVSADTYVTLTDGTGIVHMAPAFGEDDNRVCKKYGLPFVNLVDEQGCFVESVTPWAGMFVKDADPKIVEALKESGQLYKAFDYTHNYPYCWRCHTALLYYARDAWFIKMTDLRDQLLANNDTIHWLPDNIRTGRFGNFLENVIDWSISRERYWGTPLPIWECNEGCGHRHCIGSIEELRSMGKGGSQAVPENIELHKPYIDAVILACPECGKDMHRIPEVIDCWFDSGAMPFAQWHYPFENKQLFNENFPADFISEAVDQTRGWFYSLLAISTLLFKKAPYKNVIVMGHVQDAEGKKMSKSLGNVIDPMVALKRHGADAVRWYFFISSAPWLSTRFSDDMVVESQRKFMGTIWNTYAFYVLYANIDGFNPANYKLEHDKLPTMDRWVLSRLHSLIKKVDESLGKYELTEPARAMTQFVDELSNWYIRRCRGRFWAAGMEQDKINAYMTLHYVLMTISKLSAPFVPFIAEQMYQNLITGLNDKAEGRALPESVHLCEFPVPELSWINPTLEEEMDQVLSVVVLGRAARNAVNIKNRQPLSEMIVGVKEESGRSVDSPETIEIIADELNVKAVRFVPSSVVEEYTAYRFKPQLRTLGPKYGKLVPKITEALNADSNANMEQLKKGTLHLNVDNTAVELTMEDVLVEVGQREGFAVQIDRDLSVVLDINLTEDLIEEGYVRELVSKLQTMRKEADFDVMDRIVVRHSKNDRLTNVFERNRDMIAAEVLADDISEGAVKDPEGYGKEWQINDQQLGLWVKRS
ncbi:MAG: isoleucine--tRNA ligase [Defluviitaleaceae bacterium]|nr:isoleucine--tRNA ligase [Defluviitaleaceae bacterium]